MKHDVPPDFGRGAPTQFKKLAVRNVAKVNRTTFSSLISTYSLVRVDADFFLKKKVESNSRLSGP